MFVILNNITSLDIFYSIIIIASSLLIINKFNLNINSCIYIIIIIILLIIYKYYNIEKLTISNNKLNTFELDINMDKYNNILIILNNIYKYEKYNEYTFKIIIYYFKLFIIDNDNDNDNDNNKLYYMKQILNNLSSMIIAIPLEYHNDIQLNINNLQNELLTFIKNNKNIQNNKYDKYFDLY